MCLVKNVEENKYFSALLSALDKIDNEYIVQKYRSISGVYRLQKPERVFVAELYHQLRYIQQTGASDSLANHFFHIELTKTDLSISHQNSCNLKLPKKSISPDIVLHKSQLDYTNKNQILVCEVKMEGASSKSILKDINKLMFYKISRLNFQNAVFIYTGKKYDIERSLNTGIPTNFVTIFIRPHDF